MKPPTTAIIEAKNALTVECISLKEALDQNRLISILHRKRTIARIKRIELFIVDLDSWLKEIEG